MTLSRRSAPARHPQRTRERILEAALSVAAERGFAGATTRAIAARAGVNEVTLFRHFKDKAGLLRALVDHHMGRLAATSFAFPPPGGTFEERLASFGEALAWRLEENRPLILVGLREARTQATLGRLVGQVPGILRRMVAAWFEQEQRAGAMRGVDPELAAQAYLGMFFAAVVALWAVGGEMPFDRARLVRAFTEIFVRGTAR